MRDAICLPTALSALATQAGADVPECRPKRAVLSVAPVSLDLPRIPPAGYVEVAFTIAPTGKPQDIVLLSSHADYPAANAWALKIAADARFDPPSSPCTQTMKVRFSAK
jgi:TonB family protein